MNELPCIPDERRNEVPMSEVQLSMRVIALEERLKDQRRFIAALWTKAFPEKSITEAEYEVGISNTLEPDEGDD